MTNATWPASLPQDPLAQGFSEQAPNTVIRTTMEAGPPKMRRRFTAGIRNIECQLRLTSAQTDTLDLFFETTLAGGSLSFDWKHPRTGATVTFRFVEPPSYGAVARGTLWWASLKLEILP
jgi:hypothetical protein